VVVDALLIQTRENSRSLEAQLKIMIYDPREEPES
jgi:hypothetical protein